MTAKEYLSQYRDADREIQAKVDQIARLRDMATHITSMSTGDRVQSSPENNIERICAKIRELSILCETCRNERWEKIAVKLNYILPLGVDITRRSFTGAAAAVFYYSLYGRHKYIFNHNIP